MAQGQNYSALPTQDPGDASAGFIDQRDGFNTSQAAIVAAQVAGDYATGKSDATQDILQSTQRCHRFFSQFGKETPQGQMTTALALFLKYAWKPFLWIMVMYVKVLMTLYNVYSLLPMNIISMIFGAALCFFGGTYFAAIAAVEAFRQFGGAGLWEELSTCYEEASRAHIALDEDAKIDADRNGIPDVEEMNFNIWSTHVAKVSMMAVKDPLRLQKAVQYLMITWVSVLAVLKFQFARTVALCLAMAEFVELPVCRTVGPLLALALGPDLNHWCFPIISTIIKVAAVVVASYSQACVSAYYSALRGSKMFAEGLINMLDKVLYMHKLPVARDANGNFDPNASILDECVAYPLAGVGIYWQFTHAFDLSFPYSLIMFPLSVVEWFLEWQIFAM